MRRLLKNIFLLVLVGIYSQAAAQRYTLRNYSVKDGLPQSQVFGVLEDDNGYFWIATMGGGLARFDGSEFKVYTTQDGLQSNTINHIRFDSHKHIWMMHPRGITMFDGATFKAFPFPDSLSKKEHITYLFELQDTMYVISRRTECLAKIYDDSVHYLPRPEPRTYLTAIQLKDHSSFVFVTDTSFLHIMPSGERRSFTSHGLFTNATRAFYNHGLCFQTDKGFFRYEPDREDFTRLDLGITNQIRHYDSLTNVYWTETKKSLLREWFVGDKHYVDTVLVDADVTGVTVDSEGLTWITTSGMGIFKYFIQDFDQVKASNINCIMAIEMDDRHNLWVGSSTRGLRRIGNDGAVRKYTNDSDLGRNFIHCIVRDHQGTIWVGTADGLGTYNTKADRIEWLKAEDLSNGWIGCLTFDNHNHAWVGTMKGLIYYDGHSIKSYTTADGLNSNSILSIYYDERSNSIYAGTDDGLAVVHNGVVTRYDVGALSNASILSVNPYLTDYLLLGSAGSGIAVINPSTHQMKMLTARDGLASDFVYFVKADEKDRLWIGTEKGINRVILDDHLGVRENRHYNQDNGLLGVETNHNAIYLSPDEKYFGLIDGLYVYNAPMQIPGKTFSIHLTDVQVFYGEYPSRQYSDSLMGFYKIPYNPNFPADRNHITFKFNRVDKRFPKSVKFKYYLENFDKTWSQPSSINQVTYGNLPPGNYKFRVVASNKSGNWDDQQLVYPFTVEAPFYQTTAFFVAIGILIAGVVVLILYLRVKARVDKMLLLERIRIDEQEILRKEIARDFHDEMGNQLTRIINYVSQLKMNGHGNGSTALYAKVEDSAKYLYTGTRDFIWAIDPMNDELSKLFIHIRDFGEKLFEEKGICFRAFNEVRSTVPLPYGFSREANLIFKEVMTNAFRHSGARNVKLSLTQTATNYALAFEDDGHGFDREAQQKTNGIDNIRHRARKIGCHLTIQSSCESGTIILLNIPANKSIKHGITI